MITTFLRFNGIHPALTSFGHTRILGSHAFCPAQGQVWQSSGRERDTLVANLTAATNSQNHCGVSGKWAIPVCCRSPRRELDFLTMLDALTGRVMSQWLVHQSQDQEAWSGRLRAMFVCFQVTALCSFQPAAAAACAGNRCIHQPLAMGISLGHSHQVACPPGFQSAANQRFLTSSSSIPGTSLPWLLRLSQAQKAPQALPTLYRQ